MTTTEDSAETTTEEATPGRARSLFFSGDEGVVLTCGLALSFVFVGVLAAGSILNPERAQLHVGVTAITLVFGRAGGMAFGYGVGLGHGAVIAITVACESLSVLLTYPLFVLSWRHLIVHPILAKTTSKITRAAERHQEVIHRYGLFGLFAFVWFPFWMTGPIVGAVVGFLLGLRSWVTLSVVLGGNVAAVVCWALLLHEIHARVAVFSPIAPMVLIIALIVVVAIAHVLRDKQNAQGR